MRYTKTIAVSLSLVLMLGLAFGAVAQAPAAGAPAAAAGAPPAGGPGGPGGPGGGGFGRMTPEQMGAATKAQAGMVAEALGLNAEQTTKLTDAFKTFREEQMKAMMALRQEGAERPDMAKMQETAKAERQKFEDGLKKFVTPEQATKAALYLGATMARWQNMAMVIDDMKLDAKTKTAATKLILAYVEEAEKAGQGATTQEQREAVRATLRASREKLDTEMAKVLSPEQAKEWTEKTPMRGGMRGGPGGGGDRGERRGPGGDR